MLGDDMAWRDPDKFLEAPAWVSAAPRLRIPLQNVGRLTWLDLIPLSQQRQSSKISGCRALFRSLRAGTPKHKDRKGVDVSATRCPATWHP